EMQMKGQLNDGTEKEAGMKYLTRLSVTHSGGELTSKNNAFQLKQADEAIIYITAGTDFRDFDFEKETAKSIANALKKSYQDEKEIHLSNYKKLFDKASISLENTEKTQAKLPTDKRLVAYMDNPMDNE